MRGWKQIGFVAVAAVSAGGGGMAWGRASAPPPPPVTQLTPAPTAPSGRSTRDTGGGLTEAKTVTITPCRIVDTRKAGGVLASGSTRSFTVRGSGSAFAGQGGKAGGCGISGAATAVEATISVISPAGVGFLRAWPANVAKPTATFLNYSGPNISSTGNLAVCNTFCSGGDLKVEANSSGTHVVIDVIAYSVKPLAAKISNDGTQIQSSRVVSVSHPATGTFIITFDRNVEACVPTATLWSTLRTTALFTGGAGPTLILSLQDTLAPYPGVDATFDIVVDC